MIEVIDIGVKGSVAYRISGKITEAEMKSIFAIFRKKIENREDLIIYQEVVDFGGAEIDAMIEKLKFLTGFGLSHFKKIAVVTHKKFIHKLVDIEGRLFKGIDMKGFSIDQKDDAVEYLRD